MARFIYQPIDDDYTLKQATPDNFICTIEITDATYAIDAQGYIYPNVKVQDPIYLNYLYNLLQSCGSDDAIMIYVQGNDIAQFNRYNVYTTDSVDTHDYSYGLLWELRGTTYPNSSHRSISIKYSPTTCPVCGSSLSESDFLDADNILQCRNSSCWVHRYVAINRFLIVSCELPEYTNIVRPYVDLGKVYRPSHLYKLDIYDSNFIDDDSFQKFLEKIAETRGNVSLSSYLMSLPLIDYTIDGFRINPQAINSDFTPDRFITYVCNLSSEYVLELNNYNHPYAYRNWLEAYGAGINMYMSIEAFFEYAKYFYSNDHNTIETNELSSLGVFKK